MLNCTQNRLSLALQFILLALFFVGCKRDNRTTPQPQIPTQSIQSCDLAFRLGRSIESSIIASDGRYSHVGIIIRKDSMLQVVHIEPSRDGNEQVRYDSLDDFFNTEKASSGCIMRAEELDSGKRHKIENYLLSCRGITFDHDYAISDSSTMYCTELVHRAYMGIGIDLTQGIRHKVPLAAEPVVLPSDIAQYGGLSVVWSY